MVGRTEDKNVAGLTGPAGEGVGSKLKPPHEIVLTNEERLEAENVQLRIIIAIGEKDNLLRDMQARLMEVDSKLKDYRKTVTEIQYKLWDKYGIDFEKQTIEPGTGKIIDIPATKT